ncbi:hypothetical protein FM019_14010 [Aliiglaciecola sp. M165]|nr:hypothetical protein FM019_14010 [Aliiglaciecola sp. M165]
MLLAFIVSVLFSFYYYVESYRSALPAKKWALVGLLFGPFVLPMFSISQHMALRHARGFQNTYLNA